MLKRILCVTLLAFGLPATVGLAQSADIPILNNIELSVGQSVVFYGYVGECGTPPTKIRLPQVRVGTLSVGRVGARQARRCGGRTPAIEIVFTATRAGTENFRINEDRFTATVRN